MNDFLSRYFSCIGILLYQEYAYMNYKSLYPIELSTNFLDALLINTILSNHYVHFNSKMIFSQKGSSTVFMVASAFFGE